MRELWDSVWCTSWTLRSVIDYQPSMLREFSHFHPNMLRIIKYVHYNEYADLRLTRKKASKRCVQVAAKCSRSDINLVSQ